MVSTENPGFRQWSVLRLAPSIAETSAVYNQFAVAAQSWQEVTLCSYFLSGLEPPGEVKVFEGDGTVHGFLRALRAALADRPYNIIHCHSAHVACLFLWATLFDATARRIPRTFSAHCSFSNLKLRNRAMLLPVFLAFNRIAFCSNSTLQSYPAWLKRLHPRPFVVVRNGVDVERVDRGARRNLAQNTAPQDKVFRVASVGRLIDLKNPYVILDAFAQSGITRSQLIFIGGGKLHNGIVATSRRLGVEQRVEITGIVPRDSVYQRLQSLDVLVSASRREGMPVAVLEAMASRIPVILSDIPPHREIADGVDFIPFVDPDDTEGFARELRRFREMGEQRRKIIGDQCRQLVQRRFSLQSMYDGYIELYRGMEATRNAA